MASLDACNEEDLSVVFTKFGNAASALSFEEVNNDDLLLHDSSREHDALTLLDDVADSSD